MILRTLALVAILSACGARSGRLADHVRDASAPPGAGSRAPDAGGVDDAARPADAAPPDGGPPACELELLVPPTMLVGDAGYHHRGPRLAARAGGFDLAFVRMCACSDIPRAMLGRVDTAATLALDGAPELLGYTSFDARGWPEIASDGRSLAICRWQREGGVEQVIYTLRRDDGVRAWPLPDAEACLPPAGDGETWLAAWLGEDAAWAQLHALDGEPLDPPRVALVEPDGMSAPRGDASTAAYARGLAWAAHHSGGGHIDIVVRPRGGLEAAWQLVGTGPIAAGPEVVRWPFDDTAIALAWLRGPAGVTQQLHLAVVGEDGIHRVDRDARPLMEGANALAATWLERGLLLATLDWGDIDPTAGRLQLSVHGPDGESRGRELSFEVRRDLSSAWPSQIAAASDGERALLVWESMIERPSHGEPLYALHGALLGCAR